MRFFTELKRRNVIRMAGLYLVGAWLITQVAGTVLPMFDAPAWLPRSVVVLLAIGFVPALVFAWVFEMTPSGLKRDDEVAPAESIAPQTARRMDRMLLVVMALALGYFAFDKFVLAPAREMTPAPVTTEAAGLSTPATSEASIAVLPFLNMSTDVENGFFADGISEELLNVLAGIDGLKVASRTSSFSFKGKDTPIPEIARQLDVRHVLEGSVRKQGQRVRITAQLIHAGSDGHLWSETYDRDLVDIFKVQEEIAQAISGELEGILGKRRVAVAAATANLDAYQSFLRGRARFHQRNEVKAAIDDLARAVELDPGFAEAWVYLAATWSVAPGYDDSVAASMAKANRALDEALARAAGLVPKHPMVLAMQAQSLQSQGDWSAALALSGEAARLSVQDSNPKQWLGQRLLHAGYIDEAVSTLEEAQRMDPLAGINNGYLAIAHLASGQRQHGEVAARQARKQGWRIGMRIVIFDLAAAGERDRALAIIDELIQDDAPNPLPPLGRALREAIRNPKSADAYLALRALDPGITGPAEEGIAIGRADLLLDWSERNAQLPRDQREEEWWLRVAWLPSTAGLREHPRFFAIADNLGLVRLWESRGYPPGCKRVAAPGGDHLVCAGMRQ